MLASPWSDRRPSYDFVIVGSGYGGAVTAARLAAADLDPKPSVCILERGREWPLGSFPDTFERVMAEQRSPVNPLGLYDNPHFRDISVLKACGLGGGSLINFNVAIAPDEDAFETGAWPRSIRRNTLEPYYGRALQMLDVSPHPQAASFPKFQALDRAARAIGAHAEPVPIAVNFGTRGSNEHGMKQEPCNGCGNCFAGCNYGGKNTLYMNYLPMARNAGAEIYTQINVEWVEKLASGGWRIHGRAREGRREKKFSLDARNVVLAAGSLNSTEILLRSEMHGLKVSHRLGSGFSGNGDFFAFAYNSDHIVQALGIDGDGRNQHAAPGPAMVGIVRRNGARPVMERFIVEEGTFPSPYLQAAQIAMAGFRGEDTDAGDERAERDRALYDLGLRDPYQGGALRNTLALLVTSMDDAKGSIVFEAPWDERDGRIRIVWDEAGRQSTFARINAELRRMARELGSTFIASPIWTTFGLRRLATLHPLGGCPIGEDYMHGAADEFGRVFNGDGSIHEGLFVADGALIPASIGANPLLTIAAVAERIAERKIEEIKGNAYPERPTMVNGASLKASDVVGVRDEVLERLFNRLPHIGTVEDLVNTGSFEVDVPNRKIRNDIYWKGYLPKGVALNDLSTTLFSGYYKHVRKDGKRYPGITGYVDGRIPVQQMFEEITIQKRTNDLEPGKYILVRYTAPLEDVFYDVLKIVSKDVALYRGYTGAFPNGIRGFTAPLVRSYDFEHMSAIDHQRLYETGAAPTTDDLEGTWSMDAVANSNQAPRVAWLQFETKPDGRNEARFQFLNGFEGLVMPNFLADHFQVHDFTIFHQEIRKLDDDLLIGKYVTELPAGLSQLLPAGSLGLFHSEPAEGGRTRFGFYYLLHRAAAGEKPAGIFDALLDVQLPSGIGMSFEEQMEGTFERGACRADLKIEIADLAAFLADPAHEARCSGSLTFESLPNASAGTFPIDVRRSRFEYLRVNEASGEAEIIYRLEFTAGGKRLIFDGRKRMQKNTQSPAEAVEDYTTLPVRVLEAEATQTAVAGAGFGDAGQRELGQGLLRFRTFENAAATANLADFLLSFQVTGTNDIALKHRARLAFLGLTARFVQREYDPASLDMGSLRSDVRMAVARGAETPDYFSTQPTVELQSVFRETETRPLESLLNRGGVRFDFAKRRIYRDAFWKGSFAKDHLLGWEERVRTAALGGGADRIGQVFAGGSFWKRYDTIEDGVLQGYVVNYELHAIPGLSECREIEYPDSNRRYFRKGDRVLLMSYRNEPYRIVYDTIKVIDDESAIGVMHLGEFPAGVEFATFIMARQNYPFEKMSTGDHRALMSHPQTRTPSPGELEGVWQGTLVLLSTPNVSLLNQANPELFEAEFQRGAARYRLRGGIELSDDCELRLIDDRTVLGRSSIRNPAPELFLAFQNYLGSAGTDVDIRFALTR